MAERIRNLTKLNEELGRIDWKTKAALGHAANILADVGIERLNDFYTRALIPTDSEAETHERLLGLSRRKPTHTKIYLGGGMPDSLSRPVLWVQDYRQPMPYAGPYVNKYHNHRGKFVSIHLGEGGYVEDRLTAPEAEPDDYSVWVPSDWQAVVTTNYSHGDICMLPSRRDIHRVYNTNGALTMIVQAPRERRVSEVFNDDSTYITYPDLYHQLLGSQTRALEDLMHQQQ